MLKKLLALPLLAVFCCTAQGAVIKVEQGVLVGESQGNVESYLGIPYAAPPVGENRWRMPQPPVSWSGKRSAKKFASSCQQEVTDGFGPYTSEYMVQGAVSEDCLYLNIWRPSKASPMPMPIMVWIHGGGYTSGSGSVPIYDGAPMASKGIIVVTINYRLGAFGFLAHPTLTQEGKGSGNYGLADIIAALRWINSNATALGGDKSRITIAGQSAGSMAVHDLIASPYAQKLFSQAISESGPGMGRPPVNLVKAESVGQQLLDAAGVNSIAQLRKLPAQKIREAEAQLGPGLLRFAPVVDGDLIPRDPYSNTSGTYSDTPILAGLNADESFTLPRSDLSGVLEDLKTMFGDMAAQAKTLYSVKDSADMRELDKTIRRDRGIASTKDWAVRRAYSSTQPIYLYLFEHVQPGTEEWGAFHTSEVPYALGTLGLQSQRKFTKADRTISRQISSYWENFVKTGNPNGRPLPYWAAFDPKLPSFMSLNIRPHMQSMLSPEKTEFYRRFKASGGQLSLF